MFVVIPAGEVEDTFATFEKAKTEAEELSIDRAGDYGEDSGLVHIYKLFAVSTTKIGATTKVVKDNG